MYRVAFSALARSSLTGTHSKALQQLMTDQTFEGRIGALSSRARALFTNLNGSLAEKPTFNEICRTYNDHEPLARLKKNPAKAKRSQHHYTLECICIMI